MDRASEFDELCILVSGWRRLAGAGRGDAECRLAACPINPPSTAKADRAT